ncbi:RNA polymerase sigma-70 factor [Dyadobacter psychrotolerans]|uniref:RNA polymerase sigma-70 factor n=1 Tax=Dyadobacter psychrotolerans TaxID=2541721 RepID=A0A4R5DMB9_9BACT|nr:RNA polymerase sigma-70 factor [Dyadobacter psychrotolerans]TDE14637.1 RNA polymerase sigma-70 factor [Dyadobacter psychrotolerans]
MGQQQPEDPSNDAFGQESLKQAPSQDTGRTPVNSNNDKEFFIRNVFLTDVKKGYDLLFRHYYAALCSHAVRYVYSKEIAEDIVADVFFAFWKKSAHENITTSFRAYLFISVRNKCLTYLRWEMNKETCEELDEYDLVSAHSQPDKLMEFDELYLKIEKIINALPPQNQRVFLMSRFEGKSYQEIADKLQISKKAVEAHISKALTEFRKALKSQTIILLAGLTGLL